MLALIRNHPRALLLAILVHAVFFGLLVVSFHFSASPLVAPGKQQIVHAVTVDESKVQAEMNRLHAQDQQRRERERARQQAAQLAHQKVLREQQHLAKLRQERAAEQKQVAEEQRRRKAEQARVAKLKQQQAALAKQREQAAKQAAALAAKRKKEARERAAAQKALQAKVAAAAKQMAAERAAKEKAQRRAAVEQYTARIEAAIRQHWQVPPSAQVGMSCRLKLRLIPDGEVVKIVMASSSGDPAFDKSVIAAVKAASPLPVPPPQSGLFDQFRDLNLPFRLKREDLKQEG